ncbi:LacI family DNA-binding transcriptional regulator [Aquamicrobium segne]|uniref:LacI family DNA-binding transcriptional regulator n=1 Tax=Aquamicrobium segne TaxID=469547 RepID=A0ABW0GT37_9HYPH
MNVTSMDVARVAKVSQATVSRVLNDNPNVSEEKRAAVLAAMEAVGYRPNVLAQGLRMRKTATIGVVVAGITNPFYPEALEAVGKQLERAGQRMVLWDSDRGGEEAALDAVQQGLVDGVIFTSVSEGSGTLDEALRLKAPIVLLNRGSINASCDQVTSNNFEGAAEAARYLYQIGHRRIGLLGGPLAARTARDRMDGFLHGLRELGQPVPDELICDALFTHEGGRMGVQELLDLDDPPTAVFCVNDFSAFGAVDGAREAGLDVPLQLSVVGYDDVAMAAWRSYQLTTVSQQLDAMSGRAVELLLRRVGRHEAPVRHDHFSGALVIRNTTAPPASQA